MHLTFEIHHASVVAEAEHFRDLGYCPVECSFGNRSVVDDLKMDHHGELSNLEPVGIRAYRDQAGCRSLDPRFVVTGSADADATFAIAALAGRLPHPGFHLEHISPTECRLTRSESWSLTDPDFVRLMELTEAIARADVDPLSERWEETEAGLLLLSYKQRLRGQAHDSGAFQTGVLCWQSLVETPPRKLMESVKRGERERIQQAREARQELLHPAVAFVESPVWGWDVWYAETAPVIVAYQGETGRCSIGCRNEDTANHYFGSRGLLAVTDLLSPAGWGGRNTIIGSPRDWLITRDEAVSAAQRISRLIRG
jgi:hypothetical protein